MSASVITLAGFSGSGKSTSLRYLNPETTFIISCTNKQLQIPGAKKKYKKFSGENKEGNWLVSNKYEIITKVLNYINSKRTDIKTVVIDDMNYCLSNEIMETALVKGYEKFSLQAKNYYDLIMAASEMRDDITVVFISHLVNDGTELDPQLKMYSTGKMLDKTVNIDGLFSYILYAEKEVGEDQEVTYRVRTRTNGNDTCRSVQGCFEEKYIEPNMQQIVDRINQFENEE